MQDTFARHRLAARLAAAPCAATAPRGGAAEAETERASAYHEAAHAVAAFRLGFGVRHLSIEPKDGRAGVCVPKRFPEFGDHETLEGRAAIERYAVVLHAGNAAERRLRLEHPETLAHQDHLNLHLMLQWIEDDTAVEFAWCSYLWQRAFHFISDARQWRLVRGVADALLGGARTLTAREVTQLLEDRAAALERDPTMPNFQLLGGPPEPVRSPWHTKWYSGQPESPFPRYELLLATALETEPRCAAPQESAPTAEGLDVFSTYARGVLGRGGIRTLTDLSACTPKRLAMLKGLGAKTLRHIIDVAAEHGVVLRDNVPSHREERR